MGLILVDSSVWIDLLQDQDTLQSQTLARLMNRGERLAIGDLILMEVLQGARSQRRFDEAAQFLSAFDKVRITDHRVAVEAARHYRHFRSIGITVRKSIDVLIATRCLIDDIPLLY